MVFSYRYLHWFLKIPTGLSLKEASVVHVVSSWSDGKSGALPTPESQLTKRTARSHPIGMCQGCGLGPFRK